MRKGLIFYFRKWRSISALSDVISVQILFQSVAYLFKVDIIVLKISFYIYL